MPFDEQIELLDLIFDLVDQTAIQSLHGSIADPRPSIQFHYQQVARVQPDRELRVAESEGGVELPRYGSPVLIRPRLGQGAFRVSVTEAYNRACAVTQEHSLPALEAAHIRPFAKEGPHEVRNGLLLRADLHRLFEQGYVTVTPDYTLEVSDRLRHDYQNGRSYYPLRGAPISVPVLERERPTRDLLAWHNQNVFLQ